MNVFNEFGSLNMWLGDRRSMKLKAVTPPQFTLTGTLTTGSAVVTSLGTTYVPVAGHAVTGTGIPALTTVLTVDSTTQITLSQVATATGVNSLTFGGEPITLTEAKAHARIEYTVDDTYVTSLITAARCYAEIIQRRAILTQVWDLVLDCFDQSVIRIPLPPLVSIASVKYVDNDGTLTTLSSSNYQVFTGTPGLLSVAYGTVWPTTRWQPEGVTIRFTAGYPSASDVPITTKQGMLLLISHLYENRESTILSTVSEVPFGMRALFACDEWGGYA